MNSAFRTQPIPVGVDLHNSIKENRKGGYCTEATRRDQDVGELFRGLAGRQYYHINNMCHRLYNCDFETNKHPNLEPEIKCGVIY